MTAYEKVMAARDAKKLTAVDYIAHMFSDSFIELHGDRRFADDKAIVAGLAMLYDTPLTVIGIEKGRNTKERMERNFGQAQPEGYRKALRLMKQAEKFRRPVLCLVDTSGACVGRGLDDGKRRLFGHFAGGLRVHSVEGQLQGAGGSRGAQNDGAGFV